LWLEYVTNFKRIKNSIKRKKISYATHNKWFKKAIINPKIKIFILYLNNIPIGQIRFNEKGKKYIVDYSLDEFVRGRNFGKELIRLGLSKLKKRKKYLIEARVRKNNFQSKKIFQNLDFKYKIKNEFIIFKYV